MRRMIAVAIGLAIAGTEVRSARANTPSFYPAPKPDDFPKKISGQKRIDLIDQKRGKKALLDSKINKIPNWEKFKKPRWRGRK